MFVPTTAFSAFTAPIPITGHDAQAARSRQWNIPAVHGPLFPCFLPQTTHSENLRCLAERSQVTDFDFGTELAAINRSVGVGADVLSNAQLSTITLPSANMRGTRSTARSLIAAMSCTPSARRQATTPEILQIISTYLSGIDYLRFHQAFRLPVEKNQEQAIFRGLIAQVLRVRPAVVRQENLQADAKDVFVAIGTRLRRHADRQLPYGSRRLSNTWADDLFLGNQTLSHAVRCLSEEIQAHEGRIAARNAEMATAVTLTALVAAGIYQVFSWNNNRFNSGALATEGWAFDQAKKTYVRTKDPIWYRTPLRWVYVPRSGMEPVYPLSPWDFWADTTMILSAVSGLPIFGGLKLCQGAIRTWSETNDSHRQLQQRLNCWRPSSSGRLHR